MRSLLFIPVLISGIAASCAGSDVKQPVTSRAEFGSAKLKTAAEPIDNAQAKELFFVLPSYVQCLSVTVKGTTAGETILKQPQTAVVCFTIEKPLKVSSAVRYYELGRNNTADWELKDSVTVCSDRNSPFQKLDAGVYRIRITAFTAKEFSADVSLGVQGALFFGTYGEADEYMRSHSEQRNKSE